MSLRVSLVRGYSVVPEPLDELPVKVQEPEVTLNVLHSLWDGPFLNPGDLHRVHAYLAVPDNHPQVLHFLLLELALLRFEEQLVVLVFPHPFLAAASGTRPSLPAASDTDATAKPKLFDFKTPAGIKEFIAWTLQTHTNGSKAFYWRQWGDGIQKKVNPRAIHPLRIAPVGALLLSVQAVECELAFWKTGVNVVPRGPLSHFSFDNWGDIKHRDLATNKLKITLKRRVIEYAAIRPLFALFSNSLSRRY
ncbi:hypothetical protein B0H16DRAFT_1749328 [Mycena metata]|uniref:Uncharacterized protein n=1 Tax=Mycena metata TaxID=1033252 RepID=A0AAD7GQD0_9AGAR|nr:hypothetical protein B0H16DRAFT_1749328 [Mycena metata]